MSAEVFVTVKLYAQAGGFVVEGEIPRFNDPPEILIWGERFFRYSCIVFENGVDHLVYTEAFTVALVRWKGPKNL